MINQFNLITILTSLSHSTKLVYPDDLVVKQMHPNYLTQNFDNKH